MGALRKRVLEATSQSLVLAALLYWLGATDVLPYWWWRIPVVLLPLTWLVVGISYTWLGHALVGPYVVFRTGALTKSTVALQSRAIAGWRLHQTIFQRIGKRITVGIPTAAGERYYHAPDAGTAQALALIKGATPWLAAEFIETVAPERQGGRNAAH
jgi:putative membrane protein